MTHSTKSERIPVLDGIRGLAILLVMAHHFAQFQLPLHPIDHVVLSAARVGFVGVDLFFVLSGFLITGILYDTRRARNYFRSFYARRFLRIFPLYYAALAVLFVVPALLRIDMMGRTASDWPWFWLYASNFLTATEGWPSRYVVHFWSLAIEEQFYLVWPLIVLLLPRRALIALGAGVILFAAGLRGVFYDGGAGRTAIFASTFTRADALAMGAVVALLLRDPGSARRLRQAAPWAFGLAVPAAIAFLVRGSGDPAWMVWGPLGQVVGYSVVALASAAAIAYCVTRAPESPLNRFFASRPLSFLGRYSYAMYLIHMPVDTAARALNLHARDLAGEVGVVTPALLVYAVPAGAVIVGLALVSWKLLENPLLMLKRHFEPVFVPSPGEQPDPGLRAASG